MYDKVFVLNQFEEEENRGLKEKNGRIRSHISRFFAKIWYIMAVFLTKL